MSERIQLETGANGKPNNQPLPVPCPVCEVAAGQECETRSGNRATSLHTSRVNLLRMSHDTDDGTDGDGTDGRTSGTDTDATDTPTDDPRTQWKKRSNGPTANGGPHGRTQDAKKADVAAIVQEVLKRMSDDGDGHGTTTDAGDRIRHKAWPILMASLTTGGTPILVGPAGTGKSTAAEHAADQLGVPYRGAVPCSQYTSKVDIWGYGDGGGTHHGTPLTDAWLTGGVALLDEVDCCNANALKGFNGALANGLAYIDGEVKQRHPDCYYVCAANTVGRGASREYVGATQLDASTLDRFDFVEWGHDQEMYAAIAAAQGVPTEWVEHVAAVRDAVEQLAVRHVVGMRATLRGGALLTAGVEWETVEDMALWKGLEADTVDRVRAVVAGE